MKKLALFLTLAALAVISPEASAQDNGFALTDWLTSSMIAWAPPQGRGDTDEAHARSRYRDIASDIARVALDPSEPPLYATRDGRARTALMLLSIAFWESGFLFDVDSGMCRPKTCDDGTAFTLWQLHPQRGAKKEGFKFVGDGWAYAPDGYDGPALVKDRVLAARISLHLARRHIGAWTTATRAMNHAASWWAGHPFGGPGR